MEDDTTAELEWIDYEASLCSGCGLEKAVTMDPDKTPHDFEAIPLQCKACAARDAEARQASEARSSGRYGKGATDGLFIAIQQRGGD